MVHQIFSATGCESYAQKKQADPRGQFRRSACRLEGGNRYFKEAMPSLEPSMKNGISNIHAAKPP